VEIREEGIPRSLSQGPLLFLLQSNSTLHQQLGTVNFNYNLLDHSSLEALFHILGGPNTRVETLRLVGSSFPYGIPLFTRELLQLITPPAIPNDSLPPLFFRSEIFEVRAQFRGEATTLDYFDFIGARISAWWEGLQGISTSRECDLQLSIEQDGLVGCDVRHLVELGDCPESMLKDVRIRFNDPFWT
jgi:hypothetical protein